MTVEPEDFIQAMRSVANSVAVVTTDGTAGSHHVVAFGRVHHVYTAAEHPLAYMDGGYACVTRLPAGVLI